jgi:hypothetical protein
VRLAGLNRSKDENEEDNNSVWTRLQQAVDPGSFHSDYTARLAGLNKSEDENKEDNNGAWMRLQ